MVKKKIKQKSGMVDVAAKKVTKRIAIASAKIKLSKEAFRVLMHEGSPKGDVFETAKVAGVMAAKSTPSIIPLCHPLELSKAAISYKTDKKSCTVTITAEVHYQGRTGVEMEALTAVSAAALTIYDMMKWADRAMVISDIQLMHKSGGKSGTFDRT